MHFIVVYGSVRSERQGIRAALFVKTQLEQRGHEVTLFDALALQLPLLDKMYKEYAPGTAPAPLPQMAEDIARSDGVVVVTGEYNHSLPPGLSNLLDYFLEEWQWRPSAIVSYSAGSFGGVRAAVHLRAMCGELGMASIPSMLPVPRVGSALDVDGLSADDKLVSRCARFLDEFEWYAQALRTARLAGVPR